MDCYIFWEEIKVITIYRKIYYKVVINLIVVLLIFKSGEAAINTLYKVLDFGFKDYDTTKPLSLVAGGEGRWADYVYLVMNGNIEFLRVPVVTNIQFSPYTEFLTYYYTYADNVTV